MSLIPPLTVHIDSNNRQSGSHSDFTYVLPISQNHPYDRVCIKNGAIPKTFYVINESVNNTFILSEATDVTVTIDEGNYSIKSIAAQLTSKLTAASPGGWTYNVSYPNSTQAQTTKLTFSVTGNSGGIQPSIIFDNSINYALGFDKSSTNTFVGDVLVSSSVILLTVNEIYIISDLVAASALTNSNQILAAANVLNNPYNTTIAIQPSDILYHSRAFNSNSDIYRFTIVDGFNDLINLNGNIPINLELVFFKFDSSRAMLKKKIELEWLEDTMRR